MQLAWRTASVFFLFGLLVGSFYANLVFTHTDKALKKGTSSAEQQHHVGASGHDEGLFARSTLEARAQPSSEPRPATAVDTTAVKTNGGGVAHGDGGSHTPLSGWPPDGPIPVWVWMDYKELPGFIELNLRVLQHNAPSPRFQIHYVTPDKIKSLVPDMPEEFDRMPYAAATSDLIRTALIALHGGVYLDTDFLVQHPLSEFTNELEHADFVSYESHGQDCQKGSFSSNFVAGRKGNELYKRSWQSIKDQLRRRCEHKDGTPEQGVCCYTKEGKPRQCHVNWAGVGERTSHPILKKLLDEGPSSGFRIRCYNASRSFVPPMTARNNPKSAGFDSGHVAFIELDGKVCRREGDDMLCNADSGGKDGGPWSGESRGYFSRLAYHLFSSIVSTRENRAISPAALIKGRWVISELYRGALKNHPPPPLAGAIANLPRMYREDADDAAVATVTPGRRVPAGPAVRPSLLENGKCTSTYSEWAGQPINKTDDFQCRQSDVTFVHVPKTAGTTVEGLARRNLGVIWGHDYDMKRWDQLKALPSLDLETYPKVGTVNTSIRVCSGTCPCHQGCCWWHIPPKFLLDWRPYYTAPYRFCLVRNPFKRMLSQYSWLGSNTCPSTKEELEKRDAWLQKHLRQFQSGEHWVGDCHFIPQHWYIMDNVDMPWMLNLLDPPADASDALSRIRERQPPSSAESWQCNVVLRYENMKTDLETFRQWTGVDVVPTIHKPYTAKCSNALKSETIALIREIFAGDFERYGYSTEWETTVDQHE